MKRVKYSKALSDKARRVGAKDYLEGKHIAAYYDHLEFGRESLRAAYEMGWRGAKLEEMRGCNGNER